MLAQSSGGRDRRHAENRATPNLPHWRCIVVDDGSTDDIAQRGQPFLEKDRRFTYIRKPNGGVASARNLGIRLAGGEYILPLDGDDKVHPDYLRRAMAHCAEHPDTSLDCCRAMRFGAKKGRCRLPVWRYKRHPARMPQSSPVIQTRRKMHPRPPRRLHDVLGHRPLRQ